MSDEPVYLQRLRKHREQQLHPEQASVAAEASLTVQEREALRWAREAAGTELRSTKGMPGCKYAVVIRVNAASGVAFNSCEGLPSREALLERIKTAAFMSEEIVGVYEVRGGRPMTIGRAEGQLTLKAGAPRPGANPLPPEKMLRQATQQAAERARTRPKEEGRGRGGPGRRG
jgi:hypothetical protein